MKYSLAQLKKSLVAVAGFLAVVITSLMATSPEIIPVGLLPLLQAFIAVATSYGVFKVKNAPTTNVESTT